MGREQKTITIYMYPSRHNSDQDLIDNSLVDELQTRIDLIVREHRYESLKAMIV